MKAQDFYSWCIEHERDNLLAEWNYERNLPIVPDKIARGSDKKVWWKCKEGHEWQAAIGYRGVRRHIVGGTYRTLISVQNPLRLCRTGICRSLSAG